MAHLRDLEQKLGGEDFEVVAINNDFGGVTKAKETLAAWRVPELRVFADPELKSGMGLAQGRLPTSLIVNREGLVLAKYVGPLDWADAEAIRLIEQLVAD